MLVAHAKTVEDLRRCLYSKSTDLRAVLVKRFNDRARV